MYGIITTNIHALKELREKTYVFDDLEVRDEVYLMQTGVRGQRLVYFKIIPVSKENEITATAVQYLGDTVLQHGKLLRCDYGLKSNKLYVSDWEFRNIERVPGTYPTIEDIAKKQEKIRAAQPQGLSGVIFRFIHGQDAKPKKK